MALRTTVTRQAPRALLALTGGLDATSARVLRLKAQSLLATGHPQLILDLSGLTELDEVGAEMLRYVHRIYAIAGGRVTLLSLDLDVEACLLQHGATDLLVGAGAGS